MQSIIFNFTPHHDLRVERKQVSDWNCCGYEDADVACFLGSLPADLYLHHKSSFKDIEEEWIVHDRKYVMLIFKGMVPLTPWLLRLKKMAWNEAAYK